ncbi:MAG: hypothetical protein AMJ42_02665 [Deltaproteobacteria bacterium DG_8]|nr:MAG: hypothetical protein AMJ42_02665 [Deltaproteobacteria bacterium DG_8]
MTEKIVQNRIKWGYLKALFPLFLISLLSCVMSLYCLRFNPDHLLVFDDSYITLKFASNFFKFRGITYDGTSYLTGATSPLHIVFIALVGLFSKLETASLVVGIVFFTFSSLLVYLWTLKIYEDWKIAIFAGVMMSTSGWLIFDSLNGLETTAFIFFSLLTFYLFYVYERRVFYIFFLFLSILTRPEGWFIACALWMWQVIQYIDHKDKQILRHLLTSLCIFFLLIIPYLLVSLYCTGSLLPGTAFSKAIFFAERYSLLSVKNELFKDGFELFYKGLLYPMPLFIFPLILFARRVIAIPYLWFYYIIFYFFYFLLFPGAIKHYWCRYQHIFIPIIIIGIAGGAVELIKICKERTLQISMVALIASSLVYNQSLSFVKVENIYSNQVECTKKAVIDIALWIKYNTPKDSLIAVHDIGVVGYFSDRSILDLVGLLNSKVSKYYQDDQLKMPLPISERRVINYLKEKKPDYLVMFPDWDRYFNFFRSDNKKHFKHIYTSHPLFPSGIRYKVFMCNWEL